MTREDTFNSTDVRDASLVLTSDITSNNSNLRGKSTPLLKKGYVIPLQLEYSKNNASQSERRRQNKQCH